MVAGRRGVAVESVGSDALGVEPASRDVVAAAGLAGEAVFASPDCSQPPSKSAASPTTPTILISRRSSCMAISLVGDYTPLR